MTSTPTDSIDWKSSQAINHLFTLILEFEQNPHSLDVDDYCATYLKVEKAIELAGQEPLESASYAVDHHLFNAVSLEDVDRSDLRFVTANVLVIHHRYLADFGRGHEQAYRWCEKSRKTTTTDLRFLHLKVLPDLYRSAAIGGLVEIARFLVERVARFENMDPANEPWEDISSAEVAASDPHVIGHQLARRRIRYASGNLAGQLGTLEQRLCTDQVFVHLARKYASSCPLLVLQLEKYGYLIRNPWYRRVWRFLAGSVRAVTYRLAGKYLVYEFTRRRGAYFLNLGLILVYLSVLFAVLYTWSYQTRLRRTDVEGDLLLVRQSLFEPEIQSIESAFDDAYGKIGE